MTKQANAPIHRGFHPHADRWLATPEGSNCLRTRAAAATHAFLEPGLAERLGRELDNSQAGGSKVFRVANSLYALSEDLAVLALACSDADPTPTMRAALDAAREIFLPLILSCYPFSFHGRNNAPAWRSDLSTATIGSNLAWALQFPTTLRDDSGAIENFLRERCIAAILDEWLGDAARIHALDSMGHNWWAVLVSSAGVMAELLGDRAASDRVASGLQEWFGYPGNTLSRKQPNFGTEGDYLEGFEYCEFGLAYVCVFEQLRPDFEWGLAPQQLRGLADWLKRGYLRTRVGWRIQRFGDVSPRHRTRAQLWHTLARATGDQSLLALAHAIHPAPHELTEFLLWEPRPTGNCSLESLFRLFPTSGLACDVRARTTVTSRAGEAWCHSHLDAGTFIFQQDGQVWIDDAGTCAYSRPEYLQYYVAPAAHNVAHAPALCPSPARVSYTGMPMAARYLAAADSDDLSIWCADTNIISGGALDRSYRWFLRLGDAGLVVWDDLAGHRPEAFELRLNTAATLEHDALHLNGERCILRVFSDPPAAFSAHPIPSREADLGKPEDPSLCLAWTSGETQHAKFGTALGTRFQSIAWSGSAESGGWTCELECGDGTIWRLWFNPLADGRVMHQNCISRWRNFETDAYGLLVREKDGESGVAAIEASFVRCSGQPILSRLARLTEAQLYSF